MSKENVLFIFTSQQTHRLLQIIEAVDPELYIVAIRNGTYAPDLQDLFQSVQSFIFDGNGRPRPVLQERIAAVAEKIAKEIPARAPKIFSAVVDRLPDVEALRARYNATTAEYNKGKKPGKLHSLVASGAAAEQKFAVEIERTKIAIAIIESAAQKMGIKWVHRPQVRPKDPSGGGSPPQTPQP